MNGSFRLFGEFGGGKVGGREKGIITYVRIKDGFSESHGKGIEQLEISIWQNLQLVKLSDTEEVMERGAIW